MAYDYAISIGGTALSTLVDHARFIKYTSGVRRGSDLVIPFMHGEYLVPDKYFSSSEVLLEVFLPAAASSDAAEALSLIAKLLSAQSTVVVQQTDPYRGSIRANVQLMTDPVETQNQLIYLFGLHNAKGFWEDVSASSAASANPPSVTTGGDRPIDDMVLTFSGPGFLEHTDSLGQTSRITIDAGAGAGTYVVDVGAATVKKAGVDQDQFLTITQPWWMKWQPGVAQSFTSNVAVSASWRNKWA
jgi:hypothetical protein